ncbi:MAG: TolC family protein [Lentisphaeria bacterium]
MTPNLLSKAALLATVLLAAVSGSVPAAAAPPVLDLSLRQAVLMAVENNPALAVQRLDIPIVRTYEDDQRAVFDPVFTATAARRQQRAPGASEGAGEYDLSTARTTTTAVDAALSQYLPTGTRIALEAGTAAGPDYLPSAWHASRAGLTVSQALLQGFGTEVNLASLRQARLDTRISEYEFRAYAAAFLQQVEEACWDYTLAVRQIEIVDQSLKLAREQLAETDERIRVGKLARIERVAAEAEVAQRLENQINARSNLANICLALLRLLNPGGPDPWACQVAIRTPDDAAPPAPDPLEQQVAVALRMRPELNQARLLIQRQVLEVVKTKNGLLPKMDAFLTLGKSGYADSFTGSLHGDQGDGYDLAAGVTLQYPLFNRQAQADHRRARLARDQAREALVNLTQLVQVDVRTAYVEVQRVNAQLEATRQTRRLQEEKLRAEQEKFRNGKSTSLLVGQVQRDLLESQISEARTRAECFKALVRLFRLDGSLLSRRGLDVPGADPVAAPE